MTENWLAYFIALYFAGQFAQRVAVVLLANLAVGHVIWTASGGVNLPGLIALDFACGAYLLAMVNDRTARLVTVFYVLSILLNGALYIGGTVPDVWINVLAWAQIAVLYWGAFGDGLGALVDRLSGGGSNRHARFSGLPKVEGEAS